MVPAQVRTGRDLPLHACRRDERIQGKERQDGQSWPAHLPTDTLGYGQGGAKLRAESVWEERAERPHKLRAEDRRQLRAEPRHPAFPEKRPTSPAKGSAVAEPRKLALPHGSYKRLKARDVPKAASSCNCKKCDVCKADCRRDTIFGTETIFGDVGLSPFRDEHPCPYECAGAGRSKSLVQVFSKLDTSLQKVLVCHRGTCGSSDVKGTKDCQCGKGRGDMGTAPILEGQAEEPEREGDPFHDDAVEPAPLPPTPQMSSAASDASEIRLSRAPVKPGIARARSVSSHSAPPMPQADSLTIPERAPTTASAQPLLTSTQLD